VSVLSNIDTQHGHSFEGKVYYFEDLGDAFGVAFGANAATFFFAAEALALAETVGFGAADDPGAALAAPIPLVSAISDTAAPAIKRRFFLLDI
jgi:hypothetical protein